MARLFLVFIVLAVAVALPFLIWGEAFERTLAEDGARAWLGGTSRYAWAVGLGLLVADLLLPVPNTAVMAGLGAVYGTALGGAIATVGSVLSGLVGYGLCRAWGRSAARRLIGEDGLAEGERLFGRLGGWLVASSRWLPIFPEVVACMAGLSRMRFSLFAAALVCGAAPMGFIMAFAGHTGADRPVVTLLACALLPLLLWGGVRLARRAGNTEP